MNPSSYSLLGTATVALALFVSPVRLHSEGAAAATVQTPQQALVELRAANEALLQKQLKTLQKLDEIKTQAEQLRIFTKRS